MRNVLRAREVGWLGRALTLFLALAGVALLVAWVGDWLSVDTVGDAYQVLGIAIAAMGVPIVAPRLRQAEQALDRLSRRAIAWVRARPDAVRRWWRRRRGHRDATVHAVAMTASSSARASGTARALMSPRRGRP